MGRGVMVLALALAVASAVAGSAPARSLADSTVTVSCPNSKRAQFACTTVSSTGPAAAASRKLTLRLPRRYFSVALACRSHPRLRITCKIVGTTLGRGNGVRVVDLRVPGPGETTNLICGQAGSKFRCRVHG